MSEEYEEALTPWEARLLALMLEGLTEDDLEAGLGLSPPEVRTGEANIRRKLGAPVDEPLLEFLERERNLTSAWEEELGVGQADVDVERRVRLLLRLTLQELLQVATEADTRAEMLFETVARVSSDEVEGAAQEIEDLRAVRDRIRTFVDQVLAEIRSRQ